MKIITQSIKKKKKFCYIKFMIKNFDLNFTHYCFDNKSCKYRNIKFRT